jgi:hypothetical protein
MRILRSIEDPPVINKILRSFGDCAPNESPFGTRDVSSRLLAIKKLHRQSFVDPVLLSAYMLDEMRRSLS